MKLLPAALLLLAALVPPQETATLWLYRLEEADKFNSGKPKVWVDDKLAVLMPESEYVGLKLPPGRHVVRMQNKATVTPLNLEAGKVYFLRVSEVPAGGYQRNIYVTSAELALEHMRDLKPLEDKNVKSKDLEVVKTKP